MAKDPSLLPEDMRGAEEVLASQSRSNHGAADAPFHVPEEGKKEGAKPRTRNADQAETSRVRPRTRERPPLVRAGGGAPSPAEQVRTAVAPTPPGGRASTGQLADDSTSTSDRPADRSGSGAVSRALHMPTGRGRIMKGITLIPDEFRKKPVSSKWPQVVAVVGLALTIPLVGIPWWILAQKLTAVRAATDAVEREHADLLDRIGSAERLVQGYRATARRATALQALLVTHSSWEPFFALVESRTLPGSRYESLTVDTSGSVTFAAVAPSLRIAAAQLVAWQQEERVHDITMSGFGSVTDEIGIVRGTQFDLRMKVDTDLFASPASPAASPE